MKQVAKDKNHTITTEEKEVFEEEFNKMDSDGNKELSVEEIKDVETGIIQSLKNRCGFD